MGTVVPSITACCKHSYIRILWFHSHAYSLPSVKASWWHR